MDENLRINFIGPSQMSKLFVTILACILIIALTKRLVITTDPNNPIWMSESEIDSQRSNNQFHFQDITDYPNLNKGSVPNSALSSLPDFPRRQSIVTPLLSKISQQVLEDTVTDLTKFHTRYYKSETGAQASLWMKSQFEKVIASLSPERQRLFNVRLFTHTFSNQTSVICTMRGKSSDIVVIGAHIDSIVQPVSGRSPGADDDASGISTMFHTFQILAQSDFVPGKTLEFMAYAAEEVGLWGSQAIAQAYKADEKSVFAVLQLDMTGYVYRNQTKIGVAHDAFVSIPLATFTTKLVETYATVGWARTACSHACSDHASWTRAGYRAIYPPARNIQSGLNPNIHTVRDTKDHIDFKRMMEFVKLALGFSVELST